jgi:hypothetical protein
VLSDKELMRIVLEVKEEIRQNVTQSKVKAKVN